MEYHMKRNRGFSLVELLIAVTLLSIIMLMVTQFMSSTSWALTKTKKNQNIQTEAMEVGSQMTDSLMQATYIRVRPQAADNKLYELNTNMEASGNKKDRNPDPLTDALIGDLVVDNYPNYLKTIGEDRRIILNETDYTLVDKGGVGSTPYPLAGDGDSKQVQSFRILTSNRTTNPGAKSLYVKPEYIYLQYETKASGTKYVIYYFTEHEIYMHRDALPSGADGFEAAVTAVQTKAAASQGLLTDNMSDCYFSADTEANTVFLDMLFENERFEGYTYNYVESIVLRNSNVLTVPPQQMYKTK